MIDSAFGSMATHQIPIGLRLRKDIAWRAQEDDRSLQGIWIAEDPLTRRIFRCNDREHRILHWLDQAATVCSLQQKFQDAFSPETIEPEQIRSLIAKCLQSGVLLPLNRQPYDPKYELAIWPQNQESTAEFSRSRVLIAEQMRLGESHWFLVLVQRLSKWLGKLTQAQYSFGSPDRLLAMIAPRMGWLYSGAAVCLWLGLLGVAVAVITMRSEDFLAELPSYRALRSPSMLVGFGVIFVLTRLFHEMGHAVACKRAGASCRDAGLIVSFGMTCPYVDITDSWRIGNRWTRMWIAMAGIYTECVIAFFAALVWLSTHPGWIHEVAMQTMLVCTVTTLMFNANPLMKYDGYFVLCDWLNMQNLRERSFETLDAMLDGRARRESFAFSFFLWCYFLSSTVNRAVLTMGLLTMIYVVAGQMQLTGFGLGLIVMYCCCWAITSAAAWTVSRNASQTHQKPNRTTVWLGWTAASLLILWAIHLPLPNRVHAVGILHLGDRQPVYNSLPGRIVRGLPKSATGRVEQDELILEIENPSVERQVLDLETEWQRKAFRLETIEKRTAFLDQQSIVALPMLRSEALMAASQLDQKRTEQSRLNVSATITGGFEPAAATPPEIPKNPADLALGFRGSNQDWASSHWVSDASQGRWIEQGTLIGWLVKDGGAIIECVLPEEEVSGIHSETEVRVRLSQSPTEIFVGKVVEIATVAQTQSETDRVQKQVNSTEMRPMTYRLRIRMNEQRNWTMYSNGNAEVVFVKPNASLKTMATDIWMRNSKVR